MFLNGNNDNDNNDNDNNKNNIRIRITIKITGKNNRITITCLACCHTCALRNASPVTPRTKMTSLTTQDSHSSVVEHSNWQSGEVMG